MQETASLWKEREVIFSQFWEAAGSRPAAPANSKHAISTGTARNANNTKMIERKLDLELNDSSAILLSLLNFTTAFFIALVSFSQDVETHALSKPIIRIWRQQKCNRMKLLVQGWSESTCKLYDFVLIEIGDNESEILRRFKSGYFHPAKVIFVDAESSGLGTR